MIRDLIATTSAALLPLLGVALTALAGWATRALAKWIKDRRTALALELLANGAAGIVADLAQNVVAALKDPTKPGTWSDVAAASVRLRAIERVRRLYPQAVALAREAMVDPSRIDDLLGTVVEKAVVDLKARGATVSAGTVSGDVTVNVEAEISAPVDSNSQLGAVDVRTLVAVALALVVAAVGCPNWQRAACTTPGAYSCVRNQAHYCGTGRELTPVGDEPCDRTGRVCVIESDGTGTCAAAADGGVR